MCSLHRPIKLKSTPTQLNPLSKVPEELGGRDQRSWEGRTRGVGREGPEELGGRDQRNWEGGTRGAGREGPEELGGKDQRSWEGRTHTLPKPRMRSTCNDYSVKGSVHISKGSLVGTLVYSRWYVHALTPSYSGTSL